jgi:hypothetical protein
MTRESAHCFAADLGGTTVEVLLKGTNLGNETARATAACAGPNI